jgi:phospho-2-dehydro-3-deoxyheptonate aldolase
MTQIQIDCSHGNSQKQHRKQMEVVEDIVSIAQVFLDSYLTVYSGATIGERGHLVIHHGCYARV